MGVVSRNRGWLPVRFVCGAVRCHCLFPSEVSRRLCVHATAVALRVPCCVILREMRGEGEVTRGKGEVSEG